MNAKRKQVDYHLRKSHNHTIGDMGVNDPALQVRLASTHHSQQQQPARRQTHYPPPPQK
jgi:hypothetical protein